MRNSLRRAFAGTSALVTLSAALLLGTAAPAAAEGSDYCPQSGSVRLITANEQLKAALPNCQIHWSESNRIVAESVLALGGTVEIGTPGQPQSRPLQAAAEQAGPERLHEAEVLLDDPVGLARPEVG